MGRVCGMHEKKRNAHSVLMGYPEGKNPQGRPRSWRIILKRIFSAVGTTTG
jgi:hypothetical protein